MVNSTLGHNWRINRHNSRAFADFGVCFTTITTDFVARVVTAKVVAEIVGDVSGYWRLRQNGSDSLFGVSRGASVLTAVVAVIVGAVAFVVMVATTDLLTTEEWEALPKGDRLYAILKRGKE